MHSLKDVNKKNNTAKQSILIAKVAYIRWKLLLIYIWILCTIPLTFKTSKYAMKEKDLMYILENDEPCVNIGGICQQDTLSCPGGYQSGLCGGAANRRCCKGKVLFKVASLFFRMHRCRSAFHIFLLSDINNT